MGKKKDKNHKRTMRKVVLIGSILAMLQAILDIIERLIRIISDL